MKITNNIKYLVINFSELNAGDVFCIYNGVFMKTETQGAYNAVGLSSGEFIECGDFCKVQKVDCELIIH